MNQNKVMIRMEITIKRRIIDKNRQYLLSKKQITFTKMIISGR
jgi:hypothetical protein